MKASCLNVILFALFFAVPITFSQAQGPDRQPRSMHSSTSSQPLDQIQLQVETFIELEAFSVSEFIADHRKKTGESPSAEEQKLYAKMLDETQREFAEYLTRFDAEILANFRVSVNGIKCRVAQQHWEEIRKHPLVKDVSEVAKHEMQSSNHPSLLNGATLLPQLGLQGEGVTIAIVGSGINYDLEAFGGTVRPEDLPSIGNDPSIIEPGTFPTAKFIGGIDLAGGAYNRNDKIKENDIPIEDPDPFVPHFSHETYAAAIAAGIKVDDRVLPGIAPRAKLLAVKITGDTPGELRTTLTAEAFEYALDPNRDGSIDDKVDVINVSFGSTTGFGSANDPVARAAENAVSLGVVVVASAGNKGNVRYIQGSPGTAESVISVGSHVSVNASRDTGDDPFLNLRDGKQMHLAIDNAKQTKLMPVRSYDSNGRNLAAPLSAPLAVASPLDTCLPLQGDYTGKVVIFNFVNCGRFGTAQYILARDAGAVASIVIGENKDPLYLPFFGALAFTYPSYSIARFYGDQLIAASEADPNLEVVFDSKNYITYTANKFAVSEFSSRGPAMGFVGFKPDVLAPGQDIIAGGTTTPVTGTSFAAPYVAGLAAVLREKYPNASPYDIKALITNNTQPSRVFNEPGAPFFPLTRQGSGAVLADKAIQASSLVYPGGVNFGALQPEEKTFLTRTLKLKNLSEQRRYFDLSHESAHANPGVRMQFPRTVHLPPMTERDVTVKMVVDPRKLRPQSDGDASDEVDGWFIFDDGKDVLRVGYTSLMQFAPSVRVLSNNKSHNNVINEGTAEAKVEVLSNPASFEDDTIIKWVFGRYPVDSGVRITPLENGRVEMSVVLFTNRPIDRRFFTRLPYIDINWLRSDGEYDFVSIDVGANIERGRFVPFASVFEDSAQLIDEVSFEAERGKGWMKLTLVTNEKNRFLIDGSEELFVDYYLGLESHEFYGALFNPTMLTQYTPSEFTLEAGGRQRVTKDRVFEEQEGFMFFSDHPFGQERLSFEVQ